MNQSDLIIKVQTAHSIKPKFGDECNNCGWCCMTEVCAVGVELSGSKGLPCKYLIQQGDKHLCKLAEVKEMAEQIGSDSGCCAKTQQEVIDELWSR